MKLTDEEEVMLAGEMGEPKRWAIEHMMRVGAVFDAPDLVPVSSFWKGWRAIQQICVASASP